MEDALFITACNHKIQQYKLTIRVKNGRYFATLPAPPIQYPALIYIRSWEAEREYIKHADSFKDLQSYAFYDNLSKVSANSKRQGPNAAIGFKHYGFVSDREIEFLTDESGEYEIDTELDRVPMPVYLIDFVANPNYCPRCGGTGVTKDIFLEDNGKARMLTGKDKIKQQVVKALLTPIGWDLSDPEYGSELSKLIGKAVTEDIRVLMQSTIINCVNHLIKNQPITYAADETINALEGITIEDLSAGHGNDAFGVRVIVSNKAGDKIDCSVAFNLE